MSSIPRLLYRAVLRTLPARFRARHGGEMEALYHEALERAARRGALAWCYAAARGLVDVVAQAVRMRSKATQSTDRDRSSLTATHTMDSTLQDLRLATRSLAKAPGFTLVAIATLALGIGANTSIFSLLNAVLLRAPAHVERPDQLVSIYTSDYSGPQFGTSSYPDYLDFREQSPAIADAVALAPRTVNVAGEDGVSESLVTEFVTGNYFEMLGVRPALGRAFTVEEGDYASGASVAVLSHGFWLRRFGGDPDVIGETFRVSGQTVTVVGVAPEGFGGLTPLITPELWIPVSTQALIDREGAGNFEGRQDRGSLVIARLAEGSTVETAQQQLTALASRLYQEHREIWSDVNGESRRVTVVDGTRFPFPQIRGVVDGLGLLMLAVAGVILLIVCANVANLTLARASRRGRELAMKAVLGAGRGRIVRQLLAESAIVGVIGGLGGAAAAIWLVGLAGTLRPFAGLPISLDLGVDRAVLLFSALVTILTVFAVGLLPALRASRPDLVRALRKGSGEGSGPFRWYEPRHLLVISQVAASLVLLVGAGLFLKSLRAAFQVDPGFTVEGLAMVTVDIGPEGYSVSSFEEARDLFDDLEARAARLPGVEATSIADVVPMTLNQQRTVVSIPGYEPAPGEEMEFQFLSVEPGFMATLGMDVLAGRAFTDADNSLDAPLVLMVNETFAQRFWPDESPIGRQVSFRRRREAQVVGLVRDAMYRSLRDEDRPAFFIPILQNPSPEVTLIARTSPNGAADLLPMLRDEVASIDGLPITALQTMEAAVAGTLLPQRIASWLLSLAGGLGLLLAALGLYGVVSLLVAQRTREVGVRMALGAEAREVVRLIVGRGLALSAVGAVVGLGLAALATRFAESLLFEVSPFDVGVFASMALAALAVAGFASWVPARRAASVDPMEALRQE